VSPRRFRLVVVAAGVFTAALTLLAWTQEWFSLALVERPVLGVSGQSAAPALSALGIASLALVAALSIAGRVIRLVLGVVQSAIGVLVVVAAVVALRDPVGASAAIVTDATAVSGPQAIAALVVGVSTSAWPFVAVVAGGLSVLVGVAVLLTSARWPGPAPRYDAGAVETGTAGAWDALSGGEDPTR
jgi:hypothetical protein